jgi:hypothetical protein
MPTSKPKISGYVPQHLFDSFMSLKDSQRYESASQTLIAILSEYFGVEQQVDHQSRPLVLRSLDLGISQEELGMIQQDLAPRLNMGISTLSAKKKLPTDKLIEYTRAKDPDGIGWTYSKEDKRFYPERSLPSNPNSGSPS